MPISGFTIPTGRYQIGFMKAETTPGTLVYPAATDAVFINSGTARPSQVLPTINDLQKRNTFSPMKRYVDRYGPGTLELVAYIKPSDAAGTAPHGKQLLKGLCGVETITGGTKVEYTLLTPNQLQSGTVWPQYSVWLTDGHKVYCLAGSHVKTLRLRGVADGSDDALLMARATIMYMRQYEVGKDELASGASTGASSITVFDARKFAYGVGMKIQIGADTNSGAGYTITTVNTGTNAIGISPNLAGAGESTQAVVRGILPTPTDVGTVQNFYKGSTVHGPSGATSYVILSAEAEFTNPMMILGGEQNSSLYPSRSAALQTWTGSLTLRLNETEEETNLRYLAENQTEEIIKIQWGTAAGSRFRIEYPKVQLESNTEEGDEEIVSVQARVPIGSSGDDHFKFVLD